MEKSRSSKPVRPVPEGFGTITPFLCVENAAGFIKFLEKAFDGKKMYEKKESNGKIMHATVRIGDSTLMVCDIMDGAQPQPAVLYMYVEDADQKFTKALNANATEFTKMENQFYGDRVGAVKDEWGNLWWIGTHVEDVDPLELERRAKVVERERAEKGQEVHA